MGRIDGLKGVALAAAFVPIVMIMTRVGAEPLPSPEAGRKLFIRCAACHSVTPTIPPRTGPHLEGIVGRKVASVPGYTYSAALRAQTYTWDEAQLDRWLQNPQGDIPGLCLPFRGYPKAADRRALISYLKNLTP